MLDPKGIDFVVPLGRGSHFKSDELRYCLRSLTKHAKGIRRVVVIGHDPGFLSKHVLHLKCPEFQMAKEARIATKIEWAFNNADLSDEILFGNDDYFFLKPFDARTVPYFQRGTLLQAATAGKTDASWKPSPIQRVVRATNDELVNQGLPTFNYEMHCPIRYRRDIYTQDLKPLWEAGRKSVTGFAPRSVYANYALGITPGPFGKDMKLKRYYGQADLEKKLAAQPDRFCLSYGDQPFYDGFEVWLYNRFPTKCRFEK